MLSQVFQLADILNLWQDEHNSRLVNDWAIFVSYGVPIKLAG
jgi:hypothetical protein